MLATSADDRACCLQARHRHVDRQLRLRQFLLQLRIIQELENMAVCLAHLVWTSRAPRQHFRRWSRLRITPYGVMVTNIKTWPGCCRRWIPASLGLLFRWIPSLMLLYRAMASIELVVRKICVAIVWFGVAVAISLLFLFGSMTFSCNTRFERCWAKTSAQACALHIFGRLLPSPWNRRRLRSADLHL